MYPRLSLESIAKLCCDSHAVVLGLLRQEFLGIRNVQFKSLKRYRMKVSTVLKDKPVGTELTVQGWVKSKRKMKNFNFLDIADGSSPRALQVIVPADSPLQVDVGSSVKAMGVVQEIGSTGRIELRALNIDLLGPCKQEEGYPFIPRRTHTMEHLRAYLHLRPRTSIFSSLLRIRSNSAKAFRDHFIDKGYFEVNTPILTSCDCEGAGEVFKVSPESDTLIKQMMRDNISKEEAFFGQKTYLSVSGQMHLEAAARSLGNVFSLGPIFRAENSKSRLHLSEFYMLEAEEVLTEESVKGVINTIEEMLRHVTAHILNNNADDIDAIKRVQTLQQSSEEKVIEFEVDPVDPEVVRKIFLSEEPYNIMTYKEAVNILLNSNSDFKAKPSFQDGLAKEHELYLVKHVGNKPVFITDWPSHLKAFYMKENPDGSTVAAVDLLVPVVGELCGGSVRESCLDKLLLKEEKLNLKNKLRWYDDLRRFGNVTTGGFGMGFERYLQSVLNVPNIKDVIPFPRWPHNCHM